jgi:ATP-dependent DNA helicase DinG
VQCDTDLLSVSPTYGDAVRPLAMNGNGLLLAGPGLAAGGDFELPRTLFALPSEARAANFGRDRADQTLLCLPTDVPAPNKERYQEQLNQTLIRLAMELDGRLIVYFASRNSLKEGAQGIRNMLERNGILVLAQGIDGSAQHIWRRFNNERRAVLLGGGGYWKSEIEPARRSYCIVIPRLPIPAESDPVHRARSERWDDRYGRYFIPSAAQRMRIALSRLAWSHEERNAIVLFDRRAHTGDDGHAVLATLPRCQEVYASAHEIVREVSEWIGPA